MDAELKKGFQKLFGKLDDKELKELNFLLEKIIEHRKILAKNKPNPNQLTFPL